MWSTLKQLMEGATRAVRQSPMAMIPSWSSLVGIVLAMTSQWWLPQFIFQVLLLDQLAQVGWGNYGWLHGVLWDEWPLISLFKKMLCEYSDHWLESVRHSIEVKGNVVSSCMKLLLPAPGGVNKLLVSASYILMTLTFGLMLLLFWTVMLQTLYTTM